MATHKKIKRISFSLLLISLILVVLALFGYRYWHLRAITYPTNLSSDKIIELTNSARRENGLADLKRSALLDEAARLKSLDIFQRQYFAHQNAWGYGIKYWLGRSGYEFIAAGENLGRDFYTEEGLTRAWMNSAGHRENILDKDFTEAGVATLGGRLLGVDTVVVVEIFGTPPDQSPADASQAVPPQSGD